jgi:hypothetical protein
LQAEINASVIPITAGAYADVETSVAAAVGQIEVYKVHHHGSRFSSNASWLSVTTPKVGIISVGSSNTYGHPTSEALARLHGVGTRTFWTSAGNGAAPAALDVVAGNIVVQIEPSASAFTVTYGGTTQTFPVWGATLPPANQAPFGSFDTPSNGITVAGEVAATGWALDDGGVSNVSIYRSPVAGEGVQNNGLVFIGNATFVPGARPDIGTTYEAYPHSGRAGWGYMLLTNMLPNGGNGSFTLSAFAEDASGASTLLGRKTVVLANGTSVTPFGTIDTPAQGATVSGTVDNFGWALTPNPARIAEDGSTITVYVDNIPVGRPTYNLFRPDIASLFPSYANSGGAVGHFSLDTTTLSNGVHTIAWVVVDSGGNASGIGSRYFTVANP